MDIDEAIWYKENTELQKPEIQNWNNLFNLKPANEWLKEAELRPTQGALFGDFWLEGELSILFSDTNRGKSALAVQIAESLARGVALAPMEPVPDAQKVLYFDFEMSEKQFRSRYSCVSDGDESEHYKFSENFLRAQAAPHDELPPGYKNITEFVQHSFMELLRETGAKIVIVDNITFLKGANQNAGAAAQLMKALKHIQQRHGVSILVLAHTPKRPFTAPLTINDLQGSNMLGNFADNVFAMGASSHDKDLRYLKHIKPRGMEIRYDAANVILYRLVKEDRFLRFTFEGYGSERDHLQWRFQDSEEQRRELITRAGQLRALGKSQRQIAIHLGVSATAVNRYLKLSP